MSVSASTLVALVAALALTVATAYPTKDEEAYYYNRLHELPDSSKDVRNLDGIDAREDSRPLFTLLAKTDQAIDSDQGSKSRYAFGTSTHLDGIGGGHLVRNWELEQGLANSLVDVVHPATFNVGDPVTYGVVRKFPERSDYDRIQYLMQILKSLCGIKVEPKYFQDVSAARLKPLGKESSSFGGNYLLKNLIVDDISNEVDDKNQGGLPYAGMDLDPLGKGHLLGTKKDLDYLGGGHLLGYRKDLDSLGGGHLLASKKDLDSLGGGHLLGYKKDLDSLGGGHLLGTKKDLDSLGGGHLLGYKKDLDSLGGGLLLRTKEEVTGGGKHVGTESEFQSPGENFLRTIFGSSSSMYPNYMNPSGGRRPLDTTKEMDSVDNGEDLSNFDKSPLHSKTNIPIINERRKIFQENYVCSQYKEFHKFIKCYLRSISQYINSNRIFHKPNEIMMIMPFLNEDITTHQGDEKSLDVLKRIPPLLSKPFQITKIPLEKHGELNSQSVFGDGLEPENTSKEESGKTKLPFSGVIELNKMYIPYYFHLK